MNTPDVILHIVHSTKDATAPGPFARNARVMLRFVPGSVLSARKPSLRGLRTAFVPTEEVLAVSVEMSPEVAATAEDNLRGTAWVCASPVTVSGAGSEI